MIPGPVRRTLSPGRILVAGLALAAVTLAVLWLAPSNSYLFLPDRARLVAPLVKAQGERPPDGRGGIYFVEVIVRRASLLERLFPSIRGGSTLVPAHALNPPGTGDRERREENRRQMEQSQQVAAAVALRELGHEVAATPTGALVAQVLPGAPAAAELRAGDVVVGVDGQPVRTPADLRRLVRRHRPRTTIRLAIRGGRGLRRALLRTIADPADRSRAIIGVSVEPDVRITLPFPVQIDVGHVGGPSAGLAFALDLMEELGRDVDHGYRVAATGALELDGTVGPVGAVKQKVLGARREKVDVFLVPVGENAREARRHAAGLRVVPVKSFRQALRVLAALPPKA